MANKDRFLGSGLAFPIQLDTGGKAVISNATDLIQSSIKNIINWPYKHRYFLENYGCRIEELLEEPNDPISINLAKRYLADAINTWEKRVELLPSGVKVETVDDDAIYLRLSYTVITTKKEETFIFPFYKQINY